MILNFAEIALCSQCTVDCRCKSGGFYPVLWLSHVVNIYADICSVILTHALEHYCMCNCYNFGNPYCKPRNQSYLEMCARAITLYG